VVERDGFSLPKYLRIKVYLHHLLLIDLDKFLP